MIKPAEGQSMSAEDMARALNEWMRRYTDDPSQFLREYQMVTNYLAEIAAGVEPTYGETGAAYMLELLNDLNEQRAAHLRQAT